MPTLAYFVTLETRAPFETCEYAQTAGQLANALQCTLGHYETLSAVTRSTSLTNARVEVEIAQTATQSETSQIVAHAVVKADTEDKVTFDKNLFTKIIRDKLPLPVKITKQAVNQEELASIAAMYAVEEPA